MCRRVFSTPAGPALFSLAYALLVIPQLLALLPLLARPELGPIQQLLGSKEGATIAWIHFLAFDLFVGRWIWQDSSDSGLWLRLTLALTLLFGPLGLLCHLLRRNWPPGWRTLPSLAALMIGVVGLCLVGLAVDGREMTGLPVWIKPLKFALSIGVYSLSLQAVLDRLGETARARRIVKVTAAALVLEIAVIALQAARGTTSHFNEGTVLDMVLWSLMGIAILAVWINAMQVTWMLFRARELEPTLAATLRWGMAIGVVGMGVAWMMVALHAHTVGLPDGGPGLPLLGWSTAGGDLRVPHFFGLHALQALVLAWLLGARRYGVPGMHLAGVASLGITLLLTRQALAGTPFFRFDPWLYAWFCICLFGWGYLHRTTTSQ